jgi:SAM-dependent methyltransferase
MDDYLTINRSNWDERVAAHAASGNYSVERLAADPSFLSGVVRFDQPRLGDLHGVRCVHLQCHIGTDTLSLSRLGATMTGLDFSPASLSAARDLAHRGGAQIRFVEADVYRALEVLDRESFDLVYTGIGALCWLPEITKWATVVSQLLCPGGRLFIRDCHPMLFAMDDSCTDRLIVEFPYFEMTEALVFNDAGTYVETDVTFANKTTHEWNHGLGQIVTALLESGMSVHALEEHDSVPWQALPGQMEVDEFGEWRLLDRPWRLAASFTLQAVKV